ncbi:transposase [Kiloniella spongiae]|uniref:Transposase n=1 Tax=Kiloniella spongiae TaxID=1489064 RepID=A0A0H2MA76_9PROT|nr:transposase [Kiloniella spongiae]
MCLSEGQLSDHIGAKLLYPLLPKAKRLIGDRGYDSDEFREALRTKKITPCIPPRSNRKTKHRYSKKLYKQRHKVENMFAKLKDWRRIATRYDRCAHTFFSAICIAAAVIFYLKE